MKRELSILSDEHRAKNTCHPDAPLKRGAFVLQEEILNLLPEKIEISQEREVSQKYREIPNPQKDKILVILNFILKEVLPIKDRERQKELLIYFFRSVLSETQQLPITHLAYEITQQNSQLSLHDDVYMLRPDLLQICQEAIQEASISPAEKDRYELEKGQIENLLSALDLLFNSSPHALISYLSSTEKEKDPINKRMSLEKSGWKTISPKQAFSFIKPEVKEKMKLEGISSEITIGPKYLYIMPQSEIHEGNLSVMVIAQPVFIPELNRFILLHDQHMAPKDWSDHQDLFQKLGIEIPDDFNDLPFEEKEKFIMKQLIKLPEKFQETKGDETFLELFPEKKFLKKLRQKITRKKIEGMEESLEEYSMLLLDVFEQELREDPNLSTSTVSKLENFMKRVIFAGILDTKKISSRKRISLFSHFKKFGNLKENDFALSLRGIGFSSATKSFDTSLIECVTLSPFSGVEQLSKLQLDGLTPMSMSKLDLKKFIGERVDDWKIGSCLRCGSTNTWIGECSWCLNCELSYNKPVIPKVSTGSKTNLPKAISKPKQMPPNIISESLGSFVAGLV
jgi:hypothetical protein